MTAIDQTTPANRAARRFRFTMLIAPLLANVVAPIAIFKALEWLGVSPIWALAGGCAAPALDALRVWIARRRLDPIGILMAASVASGGVTSLVSSDVFSRLVADASLNGAWGLAFLASLLVCRPLMVFIIGRLVAGDDASRAAIWNGLWRYAAFRSAMRFITGMWGAAYIAQVVIEVALVRILPPATVATISPLIGVGATVALVVLTRRHMRAARARLELQEAMKWPL